MRALDMHGRRLMKLLQGATLPYVLSMPAAPVEAVLCFLHGHDEAVPMPIERAMSLHGPLASHVPEALHSRFAIVAPQLLLAGDRWRQHVGEVLSIVEESVVATGAARRFLTGFSFGGNGVFDLLAAEPKAWEAGWAVDPTRLPSADPGVQLFVSFGEITRRRKSDFIRTLRLRDAAAEPDADRLFTDTGEDHVGSARTAYTDERIYSWMLSRARQAR